jgi:hypothetical protein
MPIDPNIALGVRPVEMPNMLGQMGQMMQLRQAQQGFEEQNALRDAFSQGVDINDPATFKRIAGINPKLAMELRGKDVETQGKQTELGLKRTEYLGAAYGGLVKNPTIENAYSIFDNAVAMGILPRQAAEGLRAKIAATGGDPRQIAALAQAGVDGAISAKEKMSDATSRANAATATGPAYARLAMEQKERAEADLLFGKPTTTGTPAIPMGGGGGVPSAAPMTAPAGGGVPNALPATVGATPAAPVANMLVPGAQAPAAAPASAPAFAPTGDQFEQIKAINAEITRLRPYMSNPRIAANVQQLNAERTQLMASAEREYGGNLVDMSIENPEKPGTYITVKGKLDQYGVAQPLKTGAMPRAVDITSGTSINLPVARPAPRVGYQYNNKGEEVKIPQTGVPEGVRLKPDERWNEKTQMVEQVPGSAAFIEQQTKHGKDLGALKTTQATTKWGTERIDKILDPKNKTGFENNFGGFTAYATKELSGNTALVKAELDSLKSDLKNKGLQMFRAGGSIGAMTEKEWPIVESMLATITPKMDVKDARDVLEAVRAKFEALENLASEKYNDQWRNTQYHKPVSTSGGAGGNVPQAAIEMLKGNPALSADFDAKYGAGASKRYLGK